MAADRKSLCEADSWRSYFHQFHYSGGNPTYRPFKAENLEPRFGVLKCVSTAIASSLPVIAGFAGAYPILIYSVPSEWTSSCVENQLTLLTVDFSC